MARHDNDTGLLRQPWQATGDDDGRRGPGEA